MSKPNSFIRSMATALVVAIGIAAAWGFVVAWILAVATQVRNLGQFEHLYVTLDGQPVLLRYGGGGASQQVLNLEEEPLSIDQRYLLYPSYVAGPSSMVPQAAAKWVARLAAANDGGTPATYWYLVHDGRRNGRAYGVGYHSLSKRVVGYFGRTGFAEQLPPRDEWFSVAGEHGLSLATPNVANSEPSWTQEPFLILLADGKLWSIDLVNRQVKSLVDCPDALAVGWAWQTIEKLPANLPSAVWGNAPHWAERALLVRTPEKIILVDYKTGEQASYPLPENLERSMLAAFQLADGNLMLLANGSASFAAPGDASYQIVRLDPQGNVVDVERVRLAQATVGGNDTVQFAWFSALAAPMPAGHVPLMFVLPNQLVQTGQAETYQAALTQTLSQAWPAILIVMLVGGIAAAAAYYRQRHYALPHAAGWALFAFLLGPPGWLAYRLHRTWPPLIECPTCRQPAPRDRAVCSECGAPFPRPAPKGIEVFA